MAALKNISFILFSIIILSQLQAVESKAKSVVQVEGESEVSKLLAALKDEKYARICSGITPLVEDIGTEGRQK